ncbi:MAG TPA: enoyl-CoA hydratase-related protein, partial [Nitrospiria bacterium]
MTNPVHIHFSLKEGNIGIIEFDLQGKPVNLLSPEVLEELSQVLDSLREPDPPEGLIFLSRKKDSFIGGAQIEPEKLFKNRDETVRFIQTGRDLFDQIANLPFPTLAAVHGPALGGGLELALACRYRMASSHPRTRLGLPEVMLGILPAWGGTTRLPRLVGLQSALDLLLTGKQVSPKQALRMGLIDRVATTENIGPQARVFMRQIIETGPGFQEKIRRARGRSRKGTSTWFLDKTRPGRAMVFSKARQTVLARTRGHYPAPIKILEVVKKGLSLPVARALPLEQGAMEALMEEETTRNLMHVFALQMGAGKGLPKSESAPGGKTPSLEKIGVLGGGAMGSGIAQWILGRGLQVRLKDINEAAVGNGIRTIHQLFDTLVSRRRLTLFEKEEKLHRLSSTTAYSGFKSCGLVIEAVAEKLDIKKSVIRELQDKAGS